MIVSAPSPSEALDKFQSEMQWIRKHGNGEEDNVFKETKIIYFENMIQIEKFPNRPAITSFELRMEKGYEIRSGLLSDDSNLTTLSLKKEGDEEGKEKVVFVNFDES